MILLAFCRYRYHTSLFNRPSFIEMIEGIKQGTISRVIVKDLSRFGRDYIQLGLYTEVMFTEYDIHFIAINDDVDNHIQKENDITPFKNLFNEWYAKDTSMKIKKVKHAQGNMGVYMTANVPYGYRKSSEDKKKWLIDEEASQVVRLIFQLCIEGNGPNEIARTLQEKKILCPTAYAQEKGYSVITKIPENIYQWNPTTIALILDRQEYLGHTVNFKTYRKSYKNKKKFINDKNDWKIFKNTHEPIIDQNTFDLVQKIRSGRAKKTRTGYKSVFSGMLYCADCGSKLSFRSYPNNESKHSYCCSKYRHSSKSCTMHYVLHHVLEKIVLTNLQSMMSYVQNSEHTFIKMVMDEDEKSRESELRKLLKKRSDKEKRYSELDTIFQRLYEDNVSGKLSDSRFEKLSSTYEKEQNLLEKEIENLKTEIYEKEQQKADMSKFITLVKRYTRIKKLDAEIVHEFIDHIVVHEGDKSSGHRIQQIDIYYRYIGKVDTSEIYQIRGKAVQS